MFAVASKRSALEYAVKAKDLERFKTGKNRIDSSFTSRVIIPRSDQDLGGRKAYTIKLSPVSADLK